MARRARIWISRAFESQKDEVKVRSTITCLPAKGRGNHYYNRFIDLTTPV